MKHKCWTLYLVAFFALPQVAAADILAILINPDSLPFALSPNNFANSPGNFANSDGNFANSEGNFANSSGNFANSNGNYANGINGKNRIISDDNQFLGYYVFSDSGVTNL